MKKAVAIGGGNFFAFDTFAIDQHIVELTGVEHPIALYIPTAKGDTEYYPPFQEAYGEKLGCVTTLLDLNEPREIIIEKIISADIIYIGGGSTLRLIEQLKEHGIDSLLRQVYEQGTLLAGFSAGSNYLFASSVSSEDDLGMIRVSGLGLLEGFHCAHFNDTNRSEPYLRMIAETGDPGIAIEDNCALSFLDGTCRVIRSQPGTQAYRIREQNGEIVREAISN